MCYVCIRSVSKLPHIAKYLLESIGGVDPSDTNIISFDTEQSEPHLSHLLKFQIIVSCLGNNIFRTVINEGATTCIMSLSCWKALGSPQLTILPTILNEFGKHLFKPHGILTSLPIELGGKTVSLKVEVVDASLYYNFLISCTWFYAMKVVAYSLFQVIRFPYQGKIITIDQLDYYMRNLQTDQNDNVPFGK